MVFGFEKTDTESPNPKSLRFRIRRQLVSFCGISEVEPLDQAGGGSDAKCVAGGSKLFLLNGNWLTCTGCSSSHHISLGIAMTAMNDSALTQRQDDDGETEEEKAKRRDGRLTVGVESLRFDVESRARRDGGDAS